MECSLPSRGTSTIKKFFAPCLKDMEYFLVDEINTLRGEQVNESLASVNFYADLTSDYRVCIWTRPGLAAPGRGRDLRRGRILSNRYQHCLERSYWRRPVFETAANSRHTD